MPKTKKSFILRYGIYEKSLENPFIKAMSVLYGGDVNIVLERMIDSLFDAKQFLKTCDGYLVRLFSSKRAINEKNYQKWY